jgi:tert-butyl alcohol monooxygenase / tert-amyl alcohol desaturase
MSVQQTAAPPSPQSKEPYSGYYHREVPEPEWDLVRTGPNTPMGEYFRRFWQPVCLASQLKDLPLAIRVLGEDLVAFRDKAGSVGVLNRHCSHRGTSLEFGRIELHGIRCCYHGWLFDVDGRVLETPGEPPQSRIKETHCIGAYPAMEYHGIVHAYLGPPDQTPPFPRYDVFEIPGVKFAPSAIPHANNWLQSYENNMDPFHSAFLHTRLTEHFVDPFAILPQVTWQVTEGGDGILYTARRRINDDLVWIRNLHCRFPNEAYIPSVFDLGTEPLYFQQAFYARRLVPNDDEHCTFFSWRIHGEGFEGGEPERNGWNSIDMDGQTEQRTYELKQRQPGDWEAQGSQRRIAIHKLEHLGATDIGVAKMRRALRDVINGKAPKAWPAVNGAAGDMKNIYTQNSLLRVTRRSDAAQEQRTLAGLGEEVTNVIIRADDYAGAQRKAFIVARLKEIEALFE